MLVPCGHLLSEAEGKGLVIKSRADWDALITRARTAVLDTIQQRIGVRLQNHITNEIINEQFLKLAFPPQWRYDVLRALDYFRAVGGSPDSRVKEVVELVRSKQTADGPWLLEHVYRGAVHFDMEEVGKPSRWNTLRALRVLRWYDEGAQHSDAPGTTVA